MTKKKARATLTERDREFWEEILARRKHFIYYIKNMKIGVQWVRG